ncbi:MAG: flippase [Candidatus Omnitrophota bacterium]
MNENTVTASLSKRLIRNIVWNFSGQAWMLVLGFFATPYIVRHLSVSLFGVYTLIGVIVGYFSFLQLGLGTAAIKYISEYLALKEEENIRKTFWTCMVTYCIVGLIGTSLIFFFSDTLIEKFFKIPAELQAVSLIALKIGSLGFLIVTLQSVIIGVIQAMERFDIVNRITVIFGSAQIIMTLALLVCGYSLKAIITSNIAIQLICTFVAWRIVIRTMSFLSSPCWDTPTFTKLLKFGGFVTVSVILSPVLMNIEKLFLTALRPVASLTYYAVPFLLIDKFSVVRWSFTSVLFPVFSHFHRSDKDHISEELHYRSTLYLAFIFSFLAVFFIAYGRPFLAMWLGEDFAERSSGILAILSIAGFVSAVASPSMSALQGRERPQVPALFHTIETLLYIPSSYVLIRAYGATGAAYAWAGRALLDALLLQWASCRLFGIPLWQWYAKLLLRSFIPLGVCCILFAGLASLGLSFFSWANMAGFFAAVALYCVSIWRWGLDQKARAKAFEFTKNILAR